MPSRALTIVLNSNHSKKFVFLLASPSSLHENILREARNKFRIRSLCDIFVQGGALLQDGHQVNDSVSTLWVGKGEPYCGPPPSNSKTGDPGEVRIIAEKTYVDEKAVKQLDAVAALPGVRLVVGMPDLHPGSVFPIGCAIAADGIYPALIGSDVGCGIALYNLSASSKSRPDPGKLASMLRGLDEPWDGSVADWLLTYGINRSSPFDADSLGTIGAGNHFAEICAVENIMDSTAATALSIKDGALFLIVHTGSRGLGASVLKNETTLQSNPYIPPESTHLQEYLAEHDYAVLWAAANRDLVAHRINTCLYPLPYGQNPSPPNPSSLGKILDITHNSVVKHTLTIGNDTKDLWVHRKGAAPADKGIVLCPGSRGDFSWILKPTGNGQYNALSLAHGAGRRHGRQALHKSGAILSKSDLTKTSLGSDVVCTDPNLLLEERPEAYKDVGCVVDDMEDKGICSKIVVLRPVVTYKVRELGERR